MTWLITAATWAKTAYAWLKTVPAWVWVFLTLVGGFLTLWLKNRANSKLFLMVDQRRAVRDYQVKLSKIRAQRDATLETIREAHLEKVKPLKKKDDALVKTAGDVDAITDAVNDAFGGDDA